MEDKEKINMKGKETVPYIPTKPASPVITVPDPDDSSVTPVTAWGQERGVAQFRTDALTPPGSDTIGFSITFIGSNPEDGVDGEQNRTMGGGSKLTPKFLTLNSAGEYLYNVSYSPSGTIMGQYTLLVSPCTWCKGGK